MKYDFTSHIERKGHDAIAVDMLGVEGSFAPGAPKEGFDAIPMWVADMNFPAGGGRPEACVADGTRRRYRNCLRRMEQTGCTPDCSGNDPAV